MPGNDELFQIILKVQGREQLAALTAEVKKEEAAINDLAAKLKAGAINQAQFDAAARQSAASIKAATASIQGLNQQMGRVNTSGLNSIAYAVDDLQYGFKGISNNIQPILMGFEATAKYAGPVAILAIGINALYTNWDKVAKLWGQGGTKTQAQEMEELRKKTSLTADEAERLARADRPGEKVKELQGGQTEAQKAQDAGVTRAIIEAGSRDVASGILKVAPDLVDSQGDANVAKGKLSKLDEFIAEKRAIVNDPGYDEDARNRAGRDLAGSSEKRLALQQELVAAREKTAYELAAAGALSKLFPGGLGQLSGLVDKDPNAFGPKGNQLRKDLTQAGKSPEDLEDEAAEAHYQAQEREWQNALATWQEDGRKDLEKQDKAEEEFRKKEEQEYRDKLSKWQVDGDAKIAEEDQAAELKDMMANRMKTSEVINGAGSLRDSNQSSITKAGEDTAVEQLEAQRAMEGYLKQIAEQKIAMAARAG